MDVLTNKPGMRCLFIFLISMTLLFSISLASDKYCSPADNLKWNNIKQKCVECPNCHPGSFRNLSESYTRRIGEHGAERCIRCKPCPKYTYSKNGYGECRPCRNNCTEINREFDEPCTSLHDSKCGSCLNGFEDLYRLTQLPCVPKKTMRELNHKRKHPSAKQNVPVKKAQDQDDDKLIRQIDSDRKIDDPTGVPSSQKSSNGLTNVGIGLIVFGAVFLCCCVGFVTYIVYKRRNVVHQKYMTTPHSGTYNLVSDLSGDRDIEMDTLGQAEPEGNQACTQNLVVRGELDPSLRPLQPPNPRPELPHSTPDSHQMMYLHISDTKQPDFYCYEGRKDICTCRVDKICRCNEYDFCDEIEIEKSDKYVLEVAAEVCHDPIPLFQRLGLKCNTIYQEDNSRDRDPENITQKDLIIRLLHRWIEIRPVTSNATDRVEAGPPTLKQLSLALCEAGFHRINDKLYDLYLN